MSAGSIRVPDALPELPLRDPSCELCRHRWFSPHLHADGSGRCFSRDMHTLYIQQLVDGVPTCSCPNGIHTDPGKEPRCYHTTQYKQLLAEKRRLVAVIVRNTKLEDLFTA